VRKIPRPLRQTMGAVLLTAVILFVQFERAAGIREAKRRPIPLRILLTPIQGHPQRAPSYAVEDLGTLGGRLESSAADINASSEVVCVAGTPSGSRTSPGPIPPRTFLWSRGRVEDLGTDLLPTGINAQGWLVGNSGDRGPCRWVHGVVSPLLSDWESYGSRAEGISDAGQIVGGRVRTGGATRAFLWMDGTVQDLGTLGGAESVAYDLNAGGDVVGVSSTLDFPDYTKEPPFTEQRAFLWRQGRMLNLGTLGGSRSEARAINDAGVVVGQSRAIGAPGEHACRWSHGVLQDLGVLPGRLISRANDINNAGQIVGDSRSDILIVAVPQGSSMTGAFLYSDATGMVDLNTRIDPRLGWELDAAAAINDAGQIVGSGRHHGKVRAFLLERQ
jgi:probable HAF family extracellular repeat protein